MQYIAPGNTLTPDQRGLGCPPQGITPKAILGVVYLISICTQRARVVPVLVSVCE